MIERGIFVSLSHRVICIAGLAFAITGCGKAGSIPPSLTPSMTPAPASTPAASPTSTAPGGPTGTVSVTLNLAVAPGTSSSARSSASAGRSIQSYFSAKTQSLELFLETVNGTQPTTPVFADVNVGGANSPCSITNGQANCTVSLSAPVGNDVFLVQTFPLPISLGSQGQGKPISLATASTTVVKRQATTLSVDLVPVVANITAAVSPGTSTAQNAPATFTLALTPVDSAGSVISGTDKFDNPIVVSSTSTDAHVTPSTSLPATFTTPGSTSMSFAYDGQDTAASYTFQYAAPGDAYSGSVAPTAIVLSFTSAGQHLYATAITPSGGQILVYTINADGSVNPTPVRTITSSAMTNPTSIWVDTKGEIYVVNAASDLTRGGALLTFPPNANGRSAPDNTIADNLNPYYVGPAGNTSFAVIDQYHLDPNELRTYSQVAFSSIYPSNPGDQQLLTGASSFDYAYLTSVSAPITASGLVTQACIGAKTDPISTQDGDVVCYPNPIPLSGASVTGGHELAKGSPVALVFRPDGKLTVVNGSSYDYGGVNVSTYATSTAVDAQPLYELTPGGTGFFYPEAAAFDNLGNLYVANNTGINAGAAILRFPENATGSPSPAQTIGSFEYTYGVAVGP